VWVLSYNSGNGFQESVVIEDFLGLSGSYYRFEWLSQFPTLTHTHTSSFLSGLIDPIYKSNS
jgi:hypothetical protein